jgi:hypothetical protein
LQAAVQSVPVPERTLTLSCAPPHWLVIQGEPIPAGEIRGRSFLVPNDVPALLARYARDFPEHQSPPRAADRPATSLANLEVHYTVPVLPYTVLRRPGLGENQQMLACLDPTRCELLLQPRIYRMLSFWIGA